MDIHSLKTDIAKKILQHKKKTQKFNIANIKIHV